MDFEGAAEIGFDQQPRIFTSGFAAPQQLSGQDACPESDYFALGAIAIALLVPVTRLWDLDPGVRFRILDELSADVGLPECLVALIRGLISEAPSERPSLDLVLRGLQDARRKPLPPRFRRSTPQEVKKSRDAAVKYLMTCIDYSRRDRVVPSDLRVFSTNPLSIAHGACGVLRALRIITGGVPADLLKWVLEQNIHPSAYPPGLYTGLSGVAWTLLECGLQEEAAQMISMALTHPLRFKHYDLYAGEAGVGMSSLLFFLTTGDRQYLDSSIASADYLLNTAVREIDRSLHWRLPGQNRIGLVHGSSGVALFLLYLARVTGLPCYLHAGVDALAFDLAKVARDRDHNKTRDLNSLSVCWRYGSAGVGIVASRYYRHFRTDLYKGVLNQIRVAAARKYAAQPSLFLGLTGLGEFLLDAHEATGDGIFETDAWLVARGIHVFEIHRTSGIAYPGIQLQRLACDYGTGTAGIILFLHRLITGCQSGLMLDDLDRAGSYDMIERPMWQRTRTYREDMLVQGFS